MKLEEIVALSVKHNVSDLHLCNSAAPRWRRQGRLEPAPFPAPDIANLLNDWLDAAQLLHWQEHGQIDFALNLAQVRDKISGAAARCGRAPEEVTLLAVSKTKPASALEEAIAAGQRT